jgi:hypothetical protein
MLVLGIAPVALADPVTLTSGSMWTYWDASDTSFNVAGSGFAASGASTGGGFATVFNAGDTVALSDTLTVDPIGFSSPNGSVTTGGQTQTGYFKGSFQFTATPFVAGLQSGSDVSFSTPFTGQGMVQLFASPTGSLQPLISQDIIGSGTLSFSARQVSPGQYWATESVLNLQFQPAASPTPEPASLLLLGTGLGTAWWARRRRLTT